MTELEATSPDEFILVSDLEPAGEAPLITCSSVEENCITATAIYETGPVCDAVNCAAPPDKGATAE